MFRLFSKAASEKKGVAILRVAGANAIRDTGATLVGVGFATGLHNGASKLIPSKTIETTENPTKSFSK